MGQLDAMIKKIEAAARAVPAAAERAFNDVATEWSDLNRAQLREGVNSLDEGIGKYGSMWYALEKNKMNPVPGYGNVDLIYTGAFSKAINAKAAGGKITTDSRDSKSENLQFRYGEWIFGLVPDNKRIFIFGPYLQAFQNRLNLLPK